MAAGNCARRAGEAFALGVTHEMSVMSYIGALRDGDRRSPAYEGMAGALAEAEACAMAACTRRSPISLRARHRCTTRPPRSFDG